MFRQTFARRWLLLAVLGMAVCGCSAFPRPDYLHQTLVPQPNSNKLMWKSDEQSNTDEQPSAESKRKE
jgi:hypothetical protein